MRIDLEKSSTDLIQISIIDLRLSVEFDAAGYSPSGVRSETDPRDDAT